MRTSSSSCVVDVRALARDAATLSRTDPMATYPRLAEETTDEVAERSVHWTARGEMRAGTSGQAEVWLHVAIETALSLTCQRCLAPMRVPLQVDRSFRFVADEATAEAEDDDSEEDVLALTPEFDLLTLVEDELLMALPIVPRHPDCVPAQSASARQGPTPEAAAEKPNPFAVLAALRTGKAEKSD